MTGEYMQLALTMPERIDALMRQMSDGRTRLRVGLPADVTRGHQTFPLLFGIVLLCTTVVLLGQGGAGLTTAVLIKALLVAGLTTAIAMMVEAWK